MTESAKKARALAMKKYQETHRKQINDYQKKWREKNPDKVKEYNSRHWEKKAKEMMLVAE